eukprot:GAHX01002173.1.p1 GENE.GAHX01002173.1~~GAHX01002173.1.p1  ORF type:complete len:479 (-),score=93.17 GAHX01002173.1:102-1538(-)
MIGEPVESLVQDELYLKDVLKWRYELSEQVKNINKQQKTINNKIKKIDNTIETYNKNETANINVQQIAKLNEDKDILINEKTLNIKEIKEIKKHYRYHAWDHTKLNSRRMLHFLMADKIKGSIFLSKAYHFSSEITMDLFWESYYKLRPVPNLDKHEDFSLSIKLEDIGLLYKADIANITDDNMIVVWHLYMSGYIHATSQTRVEKYNRKTKEKIVQTNVIFTWVNHQKRIAFKNEEEYHGINEFFHRIGDENTSMGKIKTGFLAGNKFKPLFEDIKDNLAQIKRFEFLENEPQYENPDKDGTEKPDEQQFQAEFFKLFIQSIEKKLTENWPDMTLETIERLFYHKEEQYMEKYTKVLGKGFCSSKCRIDVYGHLKFKDYTKDLHILIELKKGDKKFKDFGVMNEANKHYCDIDYLKDKNVLYVAATLVEPEVNDRTENDIGFIMRGALKFLTHTENKIKIKHVSWEENCPCDGVYLF